MKFIFPTCAFLFGIASTILFHDNLHSGRLETSVQPTILEQQASYPKDSLLQDDHVRDLQIQIASLRAQISSLANEIKESPNVVESSEHEPLQEYDLADDLAIPDNNAPDFSWRNQYQRPLPDSRYQSVEDVFGVYSDDGELIE